MIKQAKVHSALQNVKARNAIARLVKLAAGQDVHHPNTRKQKPTTSAVDAEKYKQQEAILEQYRQAIQDLENQKRELEKNLTFRNENLATAMDDLESTRDSLKAEQDAHAATKARSEDLKQKHDAQVAANQVLSAKHKDTTDKLTALENRTWKEDIHSGLSKGWQGLKDKAHQKAPKTYEWAARNKPGLAAAGGLALAGGLGYLVHRKIEQARQRKRLMRAIRGL